MDWHKWRTREVRIRARWLIVNRLNQQQAECLEYIVWCAETQPEQMVFLLRLLGRVDFRCGDEWRRALQLAYQEMGQEYRTAKGRRVPMVIWMRLTGDDLETTRRITYAAALA